MVGLLYLKHAYNESDESVCERWVQHVYFQLSNKLCARRFVRRRQVHQRPITRPSQGLNAVDRALASYGLSLRALNFAGPTS